jgi:hypothetical protein
MRYVLVLCVLVLAGCSRGSGVYVGQVVDVGWEGFVFYSCEAGFKTSEQASTQSNASSYDKALCDYLQENVGKKMRVNWKHCNFCVGLDTRYEITSVEEIN